ncbi:hypothetical protein [Methylobacterium fujisawaense]|jgi:hypothetical protein
MTKREQLAKALIALASEHGVPNGVTPGELSLHTDLRPSDIGRLVAGERIALNGLLSEKGIRISGYDRDASGRSWIRLAAAG